MHRSSQQRLRSSATPKRHREADNNPIPSSQVAKQIREDLPPTLLSMKENPSNALLNRQNSQNFHIKSSHQLERSYNLSDRINSPMKKPDISPNSRKDNIKILDSYEARFSKLNNENSQLENQLYSEQQKHTKLINELEMQISNLQCKLQTEQQNVSQQQLLLQSKNQEIALLGNELKKIDQKNLQISSYNAQLQEENNITKQQLQRYDSEIRSLNQQIQENDLMAERQLEETKLSLTKEHQSELSYQIKELQQQNQQLLQKKNDQLIVEQQKYSKLLSQCDSSIGEINKLKTIIQNQQDENIVLQNTLNQKNLLIEEHKLNSLSLNKEINQLNDKISSLEIQHMKEIDQLKEQYEVQQQTMVQRKLEEKEYLHLSNEQKLQNIIVEQENSISQLETNMANLKSENNKLNQIDQLQTKEIKQLKQEIERIQRQAETNFKQLSEEVQKLKQQQLEQNEKFQTKLAEASKQQLIANDYKNELDLQKSVTKKIEDSIKEQWQKDIHEIKSFHQQQIVTVDRLLKQEKQENDKLLVVCRGKDEQINEFKLNQQYMESTLANLQHQLEEMEKQKNIELDDYQLELENFKKELKEQNTKLLLEKQQLEHCIKQLKQKLKDLETQKIELEFFQAQLIDQNQNILKQKEQQILSLAQEKQKQENLVKATKDKLLQVENQLVELKQSADIYAKELAEATQKSELERNTFIQKLNFQESRMSQYKQMITQQEIEIHNQNNLIDKAQKQVDHSMLECQKKIEQQKKKESQFLNEIEELRISINEKEEQFTTYQEHQNQQNNQIQQLLIEKDDLIKDLENQQMKLTEIKEELTQEVEQLNQKIQSCAENENQRQDWEFQVENEKAVLNNEIDTLQQKLDSKEIKLNQVMQQYSNLEIQLSDKEQLYEQLRRQIDQNYVHIDDYDQVKQKNNSLLNELHEFESNQLKQNSEKQQLRKQIDKLESDLELKEGELEQAYELMSKRKGDGDDTSKLQKEIQRLSFDLSDAQTLLQAKNEQLNIMRRDNDDLLDQNTKLKRQLNQSSDRDLIRRIDKSEHLTDNQ